MKIIVFKTKEKYDADLHHEAKKIGLNSKRNKKSVWEAAKKITSNVDFVQNINPGVGFYALKAKEQSYIMQDVAHDIAQGKSFSIEA